MLRTLPPCRPTSTTDFPLSGIASQKTYLKDCSTCTEYAPGLNGGIGSLQRLDILQQRSRNAVRIVVAEPLAELLLLLLCIGRKPFTMLLGVVSTPKDKALTTQLGQGCL